MSKYRICLMVVKDGRLDPTDSGLAILLGAPIEELTPVVGDIRHADNLPIDWKHVGRQRASEAKAHSDSDNPVDVIAYWALQMWGSRISLSVDKEAEQMWLDTDDDDVATWLGRKASG
jgi:hypothetical protein